VTVLAVTFVLTMIVPLRYAVLVGVGLSIVLHVVRQAGGLVLVRGAGCRLVLVADSPCCSAGSG
jgi:MFS superfamily sulfate permease-like transporter